MESYQYPVKEG